MTADDTIGLAPEAPADLDPPAPPVPADQADRRWRPEPATVLLVLVALAGLGFGVATTSTLWAHLGGRVVAGNVPDAMHYSWWLGHTPWALREGRAPFRSRDLNWPRGVSAMNNTSLLLPAVLLAPISWPATSLTALNVLNVLAVPACAGAGYWALRQLRWSTRAGNEGHGRAGDVEAARLEQVERLGRPGEAQDVGVQRPRGLAEAQDVGVQRFGRAAALVGAVVFAISPAIVNSLVGHITMAFAPAMPVLIVLSVQAWSDERRRRIGLLLGLVAAAQLFTGEEVLFQSAFGAGVVLLVAALSRPRAVPAAIGRLAGTLAVAVSIFIPLTAYPLYLQFAGPLKEHGTPFSSGYFAAQVSSFTTPTHLSLFHTSAQAAASAKFAGGTEEHLAYLGWPLLVTCLLVALLGWRRLPIRCAGVAMLAAMVLSLGARPRLSASRSLHTGPYAILSRLPVVDGTLATRFGLLAALFAGTLLAFAVQALSGWRPRLRGGPAGGARDDRAPAGGEPHGRAPVGAFLAAGLTLACLLPLLPGRLPVVPAPVVPAFFTTSARHLPAGSVVVVLPYPQAHNPVAMRWQSAAHYRFRMPGGYFLGPGTDGHAYIDGHTVSATGGLLTVVARTGRPALATPRRRTQAAHDLAVWGADEIVLGPDPARAALEQTVTGLLGRPPRKVRGVEVWTLSPAAGTVVAASPAGPDESPATDD